MSLWRSRPTQIEAFRWTGGPDQDEEPEWIVAALQRGEALICFPGDPDRLSMDILTPRGALTVRPGDWIIRNPDGDLYPLDDSSFRAIYGPVIAIDPT